LARESELRREAEERASVEFIAKNDAIAALERMQRVLHRNYTTYSYEDLRRATDNFTITNKLGEGAYGPVFKGKLHHMSVAIKCLAQEGVHGRLSFQREVEIHFVLSSTSAHIRQHHMLKYVETFACVVHRSICEK
jgi:serine/threonine protein kinase